MFKVTIDRDRCKGCELCTAACPKKIVVMSKEINAKGYFFSTISDQSLCIGCKMCAMTCPDVAITIEKED